MNKVMNPVVRFVASSASGDQFRNFCSIKLVLAESLGNSNQGPAWCGGTAGQKRERMGTRISCAGEKNVKSERDKSKKC